VDLIYESSNQPTDLTNGEAFDTWLAIQEFSFPLHKGTDGFMSNVQYAKFYWTTLKELLLSLIEGALTPIPFFEGDYTSCLRFMNVTVPIFSKVRARALPKNKKNSP